MHAFSNLIAFTRSNLITWQSNGMNSIDNDLLPTELEIRTLELVEASSVLDDSIHNDLVVLYNKFVALQR